MKSSIKFTEETASKENTADNSMDLKESGRFLSVEQIFKGYKMNDDSGRLSSSNRS
jgi:hypothetical protein